MNVVSDTASHFNYGKMCKSYTSVWELYHLPHSAKITETVVSCFCSVHLAFFIGKSANALFTNEKRYIIPFGTPGMMSSGSPESIRPGRGECWNVKRINNGNHHTGGKSI